MQGGTSGIGTHAIQLAKAYGARVAATAGAPERLERCRELGADIAIDYHDDIAAELKKANDGRGADVILDNMGAKGLAGNIAALATDGRLVIIGFQGGTKAEINLGKLMAKRASVTSTGAARPARRRAVREGRVVAGVRYTVADDRRRAGAADRRRHLRDGRRGEGARDPGSRWAWSEKCC